MTDAAAQAGRERVLVVGPSWVGDMVMAQSLFRLLKDQQPAMTLDVLAPPWAVSVVERMPEVDRALAADLPHGALNLGERRRLARQLKAHGYDRAIVLPNSWKSALIPFLARIPRRTGYRGEMRTGLINDIRRLDRNALPRTVQRYAALGLADTQPLPETLPPPRLRVDADAAAALRRRLVPDSDGDRVLALCPGAEFGPAKRWPVAHFAALARLASAAGWAVWLLGSDKDAAIGRAIAAAAGGACNDLSGHTTLIEAIDLMACADAVVCNDSGLMHIAAALDRPLVAVFGSSDPSHTPPLSPRAHSLHLGLSCSPCFQRECPLGHLNCLNDITPDAVADALAHVGVRLKPGGATA